MQTATRRIVSVGLCLLAAASAFAQQGQPASTDINRLFRLSGAVTPIADQSAVEAIQFAIYDQETGGAPLWVETQTLTIDGTGAYSVLLGSSSAEGLPAELFSSSEPRWLGVRVERPGAVEQARTLLTSVPYAVKAMKATDADTLGGRPASAYQLVGESGSSTGSASTGSGGSGAEVITPQTAGTVGAIGKFVTAVDLGDSVMFENGGKIGVGTTGPADLMHVRFTNTGGTMTGYAVQNLGATAASYSGMLFYDQNGALGQFQGFNNSTHEYRINNIATSPSINFMLGGTSRFLVASSGNIGISQTSPAARLDVSYPGSSTGIRVQSTGGFSAVDIDSPGGDSNMRLGQGGTLLWNVRIGSSDQLQLFEQGIAERLRIDKTTGNVVIAQNLTVGGNFAASGSKTFLIDHPLDPERRILKHAAAESNEVINFYSGNVTTDASGKAVVQLPAYFEAINKDYRYQLTVIGAFAQAIVSSEVQNNQFEISTSLPNLKVSWEVKGVRNDAYMQAHPFQSEEDKPKPPAVRTSSSTDGTGSR
jgi:hypothetical protein